VSRQALNDPAEVPRELDRWNWGAFLLNWIWGIGNSTFIALLMFVPLVNIVMIFVLGAKGSKWAWRNRYWRDPEHFRTTQRKWAIAGFIIWPVAIIASIAFFFGLFGFMKSSVPYKMTMETVHASDAVKERLGSPLKEGFFIIGTLNYQSDGSGMAHMSIPLSGNRGFGRVVSQAVRNGGEWQLKLVIVRIDGSDVPIVLVNRDNVVIPNAAIGI
jgi:hypothetical protein